MKLHLRRAIIAVDSIPLVEWKITRKFSRKETEENSRKNVYD